MLRLRSHARPSFTMHSKTFDRLRPPRAAWLAVTLLLGLTTIVRAQPQAGALSVDTALGKQRPIEIAVDDASIQVVIDAQAQTWLQAVPLDPAAALEDGRLDLQWQDGPIRIRRRTPPSDGQADGSDGEERRPERLLIELTILPSQPLRIVGSELEVTISTTEDPTLTDGVALPEEIPDPPSEPPSEERPLPGPGPSPEPSPERDDIAPRSFAIELDVEASSLDLSGVRDTLLLAVGSIVRMQGSQGELSIMARDASEVEVLGHRGTFEVDAEDSDLAVIDGQGQVGFRLTGSNVIFRDGRGAVQGDVSAGLLVIDNWYGHTTITGANAPLELNGGQTIQTLDVRGEGLDLTIGSWRGNVTIEQVGGSLNGSGWQGLATVKGEASTQLELSDLAGPLKLTLQTDARAEVTQHHGRVSAEIGQATLIGRDLRAIDVRAQGATLRLEEVAQLYNFEAGNSDITLDLRSVQGVTTLKLRQGSETEVTMKSPCLVWLEGPGTKEVGSRISVDSCQLQLANQSGPLTTRPVQGRGASYLRVHVDEDVELQVDGRP